jgi:hypothetical protein
MRRVHEPHAIAVGENANGHTTRAKEPIELRCGRVLPGARDGLGLVEGEAGGEVPQEGDVGGARARGGRAVVGGRWGRSVGCREVPQREGRAQRLVALRDVQREVVGEGLGSVVEVGRPIEDRGEEGGEIGEATRGRELGEAMLLRQGLPTHALGVGEHWDRDDESLHGLHEPEPFGVEAGFEVSHRSVLLTRKPFDISQSSIESSAGVSMDGGIRPEPLPQNDLGSFTHSLGIVILPIRRP